MTTRRIALLLGLALWLGGTLPARGATAIRWNRVLGASSKGLNSSDRARAARLMRQINVYYGCSDTVARCLAEDPDCQTARRMAGLIVRMVRKGRRDGRIKNEVKKRALSAHPFKKHRFNLKHRPRYGAPAGSAKVTVVEFADFECPFCRVFSPQLKSVVRSLASRGVSLVYKHFPVGAHKQAIPAGRAAYAAHKQGKFWTYHDYLYKKAPRLGAAQLEAYARSVGVALAAFRTVRDGRRSRLLVAADKREGLRAGVKGTPTLFINGKMYLGRKDGTEFRERILEELHLVSGGR